MKIKEEVPEDFIEAKGMFHIATMTDLPYQALSYLFNAKELLVSAIMDNKSYLPNYYYLAMTSFKIGVINAENGKYQEAIKDFDQARENFEIARLCDDFQDEILNLINSLDEAYSFALEKIGRVIYQKNDRVIGNFRLISTRIM